MADQHMTPPPLVGGGRGEGSARTDPSLFQHARTMRQQPTPAERILWHALRAKQTDGRRWRRQYPIGPFIVDFYCSTTRLIIEVDGESHVDSPTDARRTAWLHTQNMELLRFWNNEVLGNLSGVLERIAAYPSPNPLPQGEEAFSVPPP